MVEQILYEYSFNLSDFMPNVIFLIVGIGFLVNSISIIKSKKKPKGWEGFISKFFKITGFIIGPFGICAFVLSTLGMAVEHFDYKDMLENDNVCIVEGYVENFHPMPYEGHDTEHFEINGVYFEYTDNEVMNGYNETVSHGGVITENGQYLKIKYIIEEYNNESRNIILYIAEIS